MIRELIKKVARKRRCVNWNGLLSVVLVAAMLLTLVGLTTLVADGGVLDEPLGSAEALVFRCLAGEAPKVAVNWTSAHHIRALK